MLDGGDENFAVANLSGARGHGHRLDHALSEACLYGHFDLDLGQEADSVFRAAINFVMAFLPTKTLHFGHGHAFDAQGRKFFAYRVKLERLDDCRDELHAKFPFDLVSL